MKSKYNLFNHLSILPCIAVVSLIPSISLAGSYTWDGGGVDGSWGTSANWVGEPAGAPTMGIDSVQTFYAPGTTNLTTWLATSRVLGTLAFTADADNPIIVRFGPDATSTTVARSITFDVTTGNASLNIASGSEADITLGVFESAGSLILSDPLTIDHNGSGTLLINRPISGAGMSFTKTGTGTLTLPAANTFNGGVILAEGRINVNFPAALGLAAGTFVVKGGTLGNTSAGAVTKFDHPMTIDGDFEFAGTQNLNLGIGAVTLGAEPGTTRTITVNSNTLTIGGGIANGATANGIIKAGSGILTLNGPSTFTGPILVNSGSFSNAATATFISSGLTIGGAAATGSPALVGNGSLNIPTTFATASGGVAGTQQPGGTTAGGTHTFTNTLTYGSAAVFAWQVNTLAAGDPGANTDNHGSYDKVIANGAPGSVTGGAAVFRITIANSAYSDAFWDTNKSWSNIYSGTGAPSSLAAVFSSFAGANVDSNGFVTGQGQFTFVGSTLQWTAGAEPTNLYDIWSAGLTNPAFDFDSDGDGIENGLEWILGGNANLNDIPSVQPAAEGDSTTGLTLTFTREEDAIPETTLTLEYSSDLAGPWTPAIIDQDGGSFPNGVEISIDEVPSPDDVSILIPANNAPNGRVFARLKAVRN